MSVCHICGIPPDAGFFDASRIIDAPAGPEDVLARYELHRNYCGLLLHFAQLTDRDARTRRGSNAGPPVADPVQRPAARPVPDLRPHHQPVGLSGCR